LFLRHPRFARWVRRSGCVVHVSTVGIRAWRRHVNAEEVAAWQ